MGNGKRDAGKVRCGIAHVHVDSMGLAGATCSEVDLDFRSNGAERLERRIVFDVALLSLRPDPFLEPGACLPKCNRRLRPEVRYTERTGFCVVRPSQLAAPPPFGTIVSPHAPKGLRVTF